MSVMWLPKYDEQAFERDSNARERAIESWEKMQMRDVCYDVPVQYCDGSGVIEERYVDVDQTEVVKCPGCVACALQTESEIEMAVRTVGDFREAA